jgi:hypothetical protein
MYNKDKADRYTASALVKPPSLNYCKIKKKKIHIYQMSISHHLESQSPLLMPTWPSMESIREE